jgi:hypothetical protein
MMHSSPDTTERGFPRRLKDSTRTILVVSNDLTRKSDDLKEELEIIVHVNMLHTSIDKLE